MTVEKVSMREASSENRRRAAAPCSDLMWNWSEAIKFGDAQQCEAMVEQGVHPDTPTVRQFPPIVEAARDRHEDLVRVLLERGANPNALDRLGWTALGYAALDVYGADSEVFCRLLLNAGADPMFVPEKSEASYFTPYERITESKVSLEVFRALCDSGADTSFMPSDAGNSFLTPFQQQVRHGHLEVVRYCIEERGEDPLQKTLSGRTMLQVCRDNELVKTYLRALKTEFDVGSRLANSRESTMQGSAVSSFGAL